MALFRSKKKRDKAYSVTDGKFKINPRQSSVLEASAQQANDSLSQAGLTNKDPKKDELKVKKGVEQQQMGDNAAEGKDPTWGGVQKNIMDSDGNIKMLGAQREQQQNQGFTPTKEGGVDFTQPIDPSKMSKEQVMELQKQIGTKPDGAWGSGSQRALNLHYAFNGVEPPNAAKLTSIFKEAGAIVKPQPDGKDTIGGKKPSYATNEISSGGDVSPELISSVENSMLGLEIPGLRITAGNDAYHQGDRYSRPGKSAHAKGKALDFTTKDVEGTRKRFLDAGYTYEKQKKPRGKGYYHIYRSPKGVKPKHRILDEYAGTTANTTGGHFDWKVN